MSLSVVMPVYNEQGVIEHVVRSVYDNIVRKIDDSELIVVNDCSTDSTLSMLEKLQKELRKMRIITPARNGGHGKAIRLGFLNAKKDWVFHIDSDNQFDPAEYWELDRFRNEYDIILGHRKKRQDPLYRKMLSNGMLAANVFLFGMYNNSSNSAFKLMNNRVLQHILTMVPEDSMAPTILMTLLAGKLKYRIKIVEVTHFPRKTGSAIKPLKVAKACCRGMKELLSLRAKTLLLDNERRQAENIRSEVDRQKNRLR